jgi:hypothetical protein
MKTTLEIPDQMFRELKARSALAGQPMRAFVAEAIEERLHGAGKRDFGREQGWRVVFGKAPKTATDDIQAVVDREFSSVNMDDWK